VTKPAFNARSFTGLKGLLLLILAPAPMCAVAIALAANSQAISPMQTALAKASWFSNVSVSFSGDNINIVSDGRPNWMAEKYAKPNAGIVVPQSPNDVTLDLASNLVSAQRLNLSMTLSPTKAPVATSTSLGPIGILVNGAVIFNPYEGDGKTIAVTGNVFVTDANGMKWGFLDVCNGHPGMGGMYHYHGMPPCVTSVIDEANGPSHILGIAYDGFLIYGDRDINGGIISTTELDSCNGITSTTPEFPQGIYHYVLTEEKNNKSTINCFSGTPNPALVKGGGPQPGGGMGPMPGMGGGPQPGGPQPGGPQPTPTSTPLISKSPTPTPTYTTLYKAVKTTQLICQKGKTKKTVVTKTCPSGYKKLSSKTITKYVEQKVLVAP